MLPLFGAAGADELGEEAHAELPPMPPAEQVLTDYQTTRLSLHGHPMAFLRRPFPAEGVLSAIQVAAAQTSAPVRPAGVVLIPHPPGKRHSCFITAMSMSATAHPLPRSSHFR